MECPVTHIGMRNGNDDWEFMMNDETVSLAAVERSIRRVIADLMYTTRRELSGHDYVHSVYQHVKRSGVKGKQWQPWCCPLSVYFRERVQIPSDIKVTTVGVRVHLYYEKGEQQRVITLPGAIKEFVARFDLGHYPDLVEDENERG